MKKVTTTCLLLVIMPVAFLQAQTAISVTWPLNPTTTVNGTSSGSVIASAETVGSYFTDDISYHAAPDWQAIVLNAGGVGTTMANAHANGGYVQFKISASGNALTVKNLALKLGGNNNSFLTSIEYSVNANFSAPTVLGTPTGASTFPSSGVMYQFNYAIPNVVLSPGQSLYVRVYGSHTQTASRSLYISDVVISGTTAAADAGNVTITDNGSSVILKNGIVEATITKANGEITTLLYNGADVLAGGNNGGKFYWSWNMPNYQNPANCTYTITTNPSSNGFSLAEIKLHMNWNGSSSTAAMDVDIYFALKRNVSGVYAAAKLSHPASYPANPGGEWRMASYPGSTYNWMSVDNARNMLMPTAADMDAAAAVPGAPQEVVRLTTGNFDNHYECKYDYSADIGDVDVWGWSSTSNKTGVWMTAPSKEYYPGGPMKRELMCHSDPIMLNMFGGTHYTMGTDGGIAAGETWSKVYGPFLIYCNKVSSGTSGANTALWNDAKLQAKEEQAQWPYSWFTEASYVKASGRGSITGKLVITDPTVSSPSAANMWIGVAKTPASTKGITDFQLWCKNYQFWVKTDASGNFTIPDVIAGTYNMYAFGPGAAGQMTKLNFATVTAGATNSLGNVTWTPTRVAPTVWEIGIPDRTAKEFKHGSDWWVPGIYPDPHWAKFMDYTEEFPNDVTYTVGRSNWANDWNFVQPYNVVGSEQSTAPEWKVKFNLSTAPTAGSNSSVYVAAASSFSAPMFVEVNGTNITTPTTGVNFPNPSNATIRKGIHGAFGDLRFTFPSSLLHAGANEISFTVRKSGGDIQYDYLRLEAPGTSTTSSALASRAGLNADLNTESEASKEAILYPNPVRSSLYVQFYSEKEATATCVVTNMIGSVIKTFEVNTRKGQNLVAADVSGLSAGTYLIKISGMNKTSSLWFTKL